MKNTRLGKIDISALLYPPERHGYETANFFAKLGIDIVFIKLKYIVNLLFNIIAEKPRGNLNILFLI